MPDDTLLAAAAGELRTPESVERRPRVACSPTRRAREMVAHLRAPVARRRAVTHRHQAAGPVPRASMRSCALALARRDLAASWTTSSSTGPAASTSSSPPTTPSSTAPRAALRRATAQRQAANSSSPRPAADTRAGVLGHGSVLASYAHSDQTSPIRRGLFVREQPALPASSAPRRPTPAACPRSTLRRHHPRALPPAHRRPACASATSTSTTSASASSASTPSAATATPRTAAHRSRRQHERRRGLGTGTDAPFRTSPSSPTIARRASRAGACFVRQVLPLRRGFLEEQRQSAPSRSRQRAPSPRAAATCASSGRARHVSPDFPTAADGADP
jgi:hypothetical protein